MTRRQLERGTWPSENRETIGLDMPLLRDQLRRIRADRSRGESAEAGPLATSLYWISRPY
jgi:hypothetical protein